MFPQLVRWMRRQLAPSRFYSSKQEEQCAESGEGAANASVNQILQQNHEKVVDSLKELTALSEAEIGAVGRRLGEIVTTAMEQNHKLEQITNRMETQGSGIVGLVGHQMENITRYKAQLLPLLARQQATLIEFKQRAGELREAEVSLRAIRYQTWLLTMFTEVEGTRFSTEELDPTHMLIQLEALVQEVHSASNLMVEMQHELSALLDELSTHSQEMGQLADQFLEQVTLQTRIIGEQGRAMFDLLERSAQTTSNGMKEVIANSQDAISKLQFHDPMIQRLQSLDADMADCRNLVMIQSGQAPTCQPLRYPASLGQQQAAAGESSEEVLSAGEMMFF